MNIRHFLNCFIAFLMIFSGHAQNYLYIKSLGKPGYEDVRSLVHEPDGSVCFTGLCKTENDLEGDVYFKKLNASGDLIESKFYGKLKEDGGNGLLKTNDGGFLICGHTALPLTGIECDAMLTKIDATGKMTWQVNVGGELDETCYEGIQMQDNSYWVAGVTIDEKTNKRTGIIFHIDQNGRFIEQKMINDPSYKKGINTSIRRIFLNKFNELIVGGTVPNNWFDSNSGDSGYNNNSLISSFSYTDPSLKGQKFINYIRLNSGWSNKMEDLLHINHNLYFLFGTHDNSNYKFLEAENIGFLWAVAYNNGIIDESYVDPFVGFPKGIIKDAAQGNDGKIYLTGFLQEGKLIHSFWAVLDQNLKLIRWNRIPLSNESTASCLDIAEDNSIFIGGKSWENQDTQMLLVHVDPFGKMTSIQDAKSDQLQLFYSNEFLHLLNINNLQSFDVNFFSLSGQKILSLTKQNTLSIPLSNLNSNLYFVQIRTKDGKRYSGKFIKY